MKKLSVITRLVPSVLLLSVLSSGANAMTPEPGFPVKKIPFADQIDDWHVVDARHLVISTSPSKNYLVTFRNVCHRLNSNQKLGVSSSNNSVYAGFDYVTVGGQRCGITKINKISKAQKKALTSA